MFISLGTATNKKLSTRRRVSGRYTDEIRTLREGETTGMKFFPSRAILKTIAGSARAVFGLTYRLTELMLWSRIISAPTGPGTGDISLLLPVLLLPRPGPCCYSAQTSG